MHYTDITIRSMALGDEHTYYQNRHAAVPSSLKAFKASAYRSSLLWHLIRYSKALIQAYIDIPDAELPQITVFTLTQLCASLVILPRSVSALLQLIAAKQGPSPHGGRSWPVQGEVLDEARAIVDEADYLSLVVKLYERLRVLIVGLTMQDKGLDVAGTLCCHMNVLASWYAPRVQAILGVDLVDKYPLTLITGPNDGVVDGINAANAVNSTSIPPLVDQSTERAGSTDGHQGYPGAYTGAEDGVNLFSDELWASVLDSFTNFV